MNFLKCWCKNQFLLFKKGQHCAYKFYFLCWYCGYKYTLLNIICIPGANIKIKLYPQHNTANTKINRNICLPKVAALCIQISHICLAPRIQCKRSAALRIQLYPQFGTVHTTSLYAQCCTFSKWEIGFTFIDYTFKNL